MTEDDILREELQEKFAAQVNRSPWLFQTRSIDPMLGATRGNPPQWVVWGKKQPTKYFDSMEDGARRLISAGFVQLNRKFVGDELIPNFWRPDDGAWVWLIEGIDGTEAMGNTADGAELDIRDI